MHDLRFDIASLHAAYRDGADPVDVMAEVFRRIGAADDPGIFIHLRERDAVLAEAGRLGAFEGTDFVSSEISSVANSSGVTALSTSNGKIVGSGQDADGKPWEREIVKTSNITPAKNAWREIRRQ